MTDDPGPGFRAELTAALASLAPVITGDSTKKIREAFTLMDARRGLIGDVIHALDIVREKSALLIANGYPNVPHLKISDEMASELQKERAALEAALAIFEEPTEKERADLKKV